MENLNFTLTPLEYANQWREARRTKDFCNVLRPPNATLMLAKEGDVWHKHGPCQQPQDRIYLDYESAWRMRRACGYIANMRFEKKGKNSSKPASASVVIKLTWEDPNSGEQKYVFARSTAYTSGFSPRQIQPMSFAHIQLGDCISGVLEAPRSQELSTNFISWDILDINALYQIHGPQVPLWWQRCYEPKTVADLPQLGGVNFWPAPTLKTLNAMRLELPPQDIFHFRSDCIAARPGIEQAHQEEILEKLNPNRIIYLFRGL